MKFSGPTFTMRHPIDRAVSMPSLRLAVESKRLMFFLILMARVSMLPGSARLTSLLVGLNYNLPEKDAIVLVVEEVHVLVVDGQTLFNLLIVLQVLVRKLHEHDLLLLSESMEGAQLALFLVDLDTTLV